MRTVNTYSLSMHPHPQLFLDNRFDSSNYNAIDASYVYYRSLKYLLMMTRLDYLEKLVSGY